MHSEHDELEKRWLKDHDTVSYYVGPRYIVGTWVLLPNFENPMIWFLTRVCTLLFYKRTFLYLRVKGTKHTWQIEIVISFLVLLDLPQNLENNRKIFPTYYVRNAYLHWFFSLKGRIHSSAFNCNLKVQDETFQYLTSVQV